MRFHYKFILFVFFATSGKMVTSQELIWNAGNFGFFHNQEYFNPYIEPQTMGGTQLYGSIGFAPTENHSFLGGFNYLYEFGAEPLDNKLSPTIYYQYNSSDINVCLGAFPRNKINPLPELLQTDTFRYYRPNMEGILLEAKKEWGYHNIWLDWTSRQTDVRRETFSLGLTGQLNWGDFYYRHHFIMFHFAGPAVRIEDDHIRDNGGGLIGFGANFSKKTILDSLTIYAAYALSYDQLRDVYDLQINQGAYIELNILYKRIGVRNIFYTGDGQVQVLGDDFYTSKQYNRTDVYWYALKNDWVNGFVEFGFHMVPGVLDLHQKFTVQIDLGGKKKFSSE